MSEFFTGCERLSWRAASSFAKPIAFVTLDRAFGQPLQHPHDPKFNVVNLTSQPELINVISNMNRSFMHDIATPTQYSTHPSKHE